MKSILIIFQFPIRFILDGFVGLMIMLFFPLTLQSQEHINRDQKTEQLFANLKHLVDSGKIMFGMANPTSISYVDVLKSDINKSDCKDITGSHPAFYESDFMWYRSYPEFKMRDLEAMKQAVQRGAVIGYCWHIGGKVSNSFRSKDRNGKSSPDSLLVRKIISNANRAKNPEFDWLLTELDTLVIPVFRELDCPIVFRPFHEMNGNWFWWGSANCTPDEYIKLYRIVVDYLRSKNITNLLYAWSPDKKADFRYYPGDEYVDILGLDIYEPGIADYSPRDSMILNLGLITDYAIKHSKLAALTETGCRKTDDGKFRYPDIYPDYWTKYVLKPILADAKARRIAWILSWYGVNWTGDFSREFYIPYFNCKRPNIDKAIDDFKQFYNNESTIFENDLPKYL